MPDPTRPVPTKTGFRWVLRTRTQDAHDRLDTLISHLDLTTPAGLTAFVAGHLQSYQALAVANTHPHLPPMITALTADLGVLAPATTLPPPSPIGPVAPLALRYIIAGSRLGTQVLQRQWAMATNSRVTAAHHYFALAQDKAEWPALCQALDQVTCQTTADQITGDTCQIFSLFHRNCARVIAPA